MSFRENEVFKYDVLFAEDNPGDVRLIQELLKDNPYIKSLHVITDGEEVLRYLKKQPPYVDSATPHLIILDLNLPKYNGLEVLREIKEDSELCYIPVIVLTSSQSEDDIIKSYDLHANCYMVKPVSFEQLVNQFRIMLEFWLRLARIPRNIDKKIIIS